MKTLKLSQGLETIVDDADFEKMSQWKWFAISGNSGKYYACRNKRIGVNKRKNTLLSREILNCPKGMEVDHINGDTLDNRRCNLRVCTRRQNLYNRRMCKRNTSGHKNVFWIKSRNKWWVSMWKDRKCHFYGYFDDFKEAVKVEEAKEKELFGEFARSIE